MSLSDRKIYFGSGGHRSRTPEQTLAAIEVLLDGFGITRCADVTGLDSIGIPVFTAFRPAATTIQVSNGKGVRPIDARVSALMEAIELAQSEAPHVEVREGASTDFGPSDSFVSPLDIASFDSDCYYSDFSVIEWVRAEAIDSGTPLWMPLSAVSPREQAVCKWSANGLASGNNVLEATVHGVNEIIERDVVTSMSKSGVVDFAQVDVVDLDAVADLPVAALVDRIHSADLRMVLLRPRSCRNVHVFMCVLLQADPLAESSRVAVGYGAHTNPSVASARSITEAAQSRLTFIHGAREDLRTSAYRGGAVQRRIYKFFDALEPNAQFDSFEDRSARTLGGDLALALEDLTNRGGRTPYRCVISPRECPVCVVHVGVVGGKNPSRLFG